ncbi:hypothetical protein Ocin01_07797 [Orchesella cincta]|uniref:CD109 antigen n=1 Tax=Orchesella cincta TaxID=48709 RepID=A0A1D2N1W7_ORCCI|nr:hypothetical protein Ocin01_07797 [Orchesella cincta]
MIRYFVVASKMVRPGQVFRVAVTLFQGQVHLQEIEVRASLLRNGVDIGSDTKICQPNMPETLMIRVPRTSIDGDYRLRVEGNDNGLVGGTAFLNETQLTFSSRSMTIFIQTDKPVYMQGQTVRFRAIPINTALKAFDDAVDVFMLDPRGNVVRRWLSRTVRKEDWIYSTYNLGTILFSPQALQQIEMKQFFVEEYYQPRFEVNVTMPAFAFDTESVLRGEIVANFTHGGPVRGNLSVTAIIRPILVAGRPAQATRNPFYEQYPQLHIYVPDFKGHFEFQFPMWEIERSVAVLDNIEVEVSAEVGDHYWDEVQTGYSKVRIFNSSLALEFLGGSPQVFKPNMPFVCYLTISYHDGSPLLFERLLTSNLEIQPEIIMRGGGRRRLGTRHIQMLRSQPGTWQVTIDLKQELGAGPERSRQITNLLNDETATAEVMAVAHFSPKNRHIRVSSSTDAPKVGEYIIFHVRGNFYMDRFSYLIMSKGVILLSGSEVMDATIRTFAISVAPQMAPAATIVVYHISRYGDVVADSMNFPVNGISRNNFTVEINNKKEKTNNIVEIIIRGEPGAYVGLSGIDAAFFTMQAGNDISYGEVLSKMSTFDDDSNGTTLMHRWISRDGLPDEIAYFPVHTFGIDANRTFEYSGLVVFSDIPLPRRDDVCNETAGWYSCLTGGCYFIDKKCDLQRDCADGTDESNCPRFNRTELVDFKLHRFNRMQRLYENVWLWKDLNIGPHGYNIFSLPVPERPALWMVSSIGVSPTSGFGLLRKPIIYSGVRPLFMNVEMPEVCRQGEQVGIRVTVFNYMMKDIEVMVVLADSPNYKFIHVESYGIVQSYKPRTSVGEHQHLIWMRAGDSVQVHLPIVATVLGEIEINIRLIGQIARDEVTRKLRIEPDGVPQFRHTAVLLDLSSRSFFLQYMHINVTESPIIPYDFDRYYVYSSNLAEISVVGDVVGPAFPQMPVNATSLLKKPMDSAEQNMFSFASNFYTLLYLRLTNQRNKTIYRDAFHHLNALYLRQLSFQNEDGSFSHFRSDWYAEAISYTTFPILKVFLMPLLLIYRNNSAPSVWVTSYCARCSLKQVSMNGKISCTLIITAVHWLLDYQTEEGSFYEVSQYSNRRLNDTTFEDGNLRTPNITLTAHVLISLHVVKDLPGVIGPRVAVARQKAVNYLEIQVDQLRFDADPYQIAVVAYALMITKSSKADAAFIKLSAAKQQSDDLEYWGKERVPTPDYKLENNKPFLLPRLPYKYDSSNIETTAYALMIYVARQEVVLMQRIVRWLNSQRLYDGGWASTQDSAAAMKALIDFTIRSNIRNVTDLTVTIEAVAIPDKVTTFHINADHLSTRQVLKISDAYGSVKVQVKGAGYALLQMQAQYGVDRDRFITDPPVRAFSLVPEARYTGRNASLIDYKICQRWTYLEESERSGMSVLEVTVPTGYFLHQKKLDEYVKYGAVSTLRRARYFAEKVVFYFDYLEINPTCVNFTLQRWFPVANMTRYLSVRVYDYYAPERFNETIFEALDLYMLDICQVCGSYQCPYCPVFAGGSILNPSMTVIFLSMILFVFTSYCTSASTQK